MLDSCGERGGVRVACCVCTSGIPGRTSQHGDRVLGRESRTRCYMAHNGNVRVCSDSVGAPRLGEATGVQTPVQASNVPRSDVRPQPAPTLAISRCLPGTRNLSASNTWRGGCYRRGEAGMPSAEDDSRVPWRTGAGLEGLAPPRRGSGWVAACAGRGGRGRAPSRPGVAWRSPACRNRKRAAGGVSWNSPGLAVMLIRPPENSRSWHGNSGGTGARHDQYQASPRPPQSAV
jgi:hypothetical protein